MQRITLKGDKHTFEGLLGSAYLDPTSHRLVLVYVNTATMPQKVKWTFNGSIKPSKTFTPWVTSETKELQSDAPVPSDGTAEIPASSIVTFVGEAS